MSLSWKAFLGLWLKFFSRIFHLSKSRGNSLETFSEKLCSLKWFFSQVILKANWLSFQMRYSGGVYDIRKKCYSSFSGDTYPNSIVYNNVWTPILASSGQNELGKNSKKKPILLLNFGFLIHFDFSNTRIFSLSVGIKVMNPKMPLWSEFRKYEIWKGT